MTKIIALLGLIMITTIFGLIFYYDIKKEVQYTQGLIVKHIYYEKLTTERKVVGVKAYRLLVIRTKDWERTLEAKPHVFNQVKDNETYNLQLSIKSIKRRWVDEPYKFHQGEVLEVLEINDSFLKE